MYLFISRLTLDFTKLESNLDLLLDLDVDLLFRDRDLDLFDLFLAWRFRDLDLDLVKSTESVTTCAFTSHKILRINCWLYVPSASAARSSLSISAATPSSFSTAAPTTCLTYSSLLLCFFSFCTLKLLFLSFLFSLHSSISNTFLIIISKQKPFVKFTSINLLNRTNMFYNESANI